MALEGIARKVIIYGLWRDDRGWYAERGLVWTTESQLIAKAQLDYVKRLGVSEAKGWRVRSLNEWGNQEPVCCEGPPDEQP